MRRRPHARKAGALGVLLAAAAALLAFSPMAVAQPVGKVRLGHLSPSTATVDITVVGPQRTDGSTPTSQRVGSNVGYAAVTDYLSLVPGRYSVDLRPSGGEPTSAPAVSAQVQVSPGTAQSLFFFDTGPGGQVRGQLVDDDVSAAPSGEGAVRLVQGASSDASLQALADNGPQLATNLAYGSVTEYATVAAKTWGVRLSAGADTATAQLPVASESVNTVVVTTDWTGKLAVTPLVDVAGLPGGLAPAVQSTPEAPTSAAPAGPPAASAPTTPSARPGAPAPVPRGGVPAGGGGTDGGGIGVLPIVLALGAAPLLAYSAQTVSSARHRRN